MLSTHASLRAWTRHLRRDALDHGEVLVFVPVPLFVLIARFVDENSLLEAYAEAVGGDVGDSEDLGPVDRRQTSRLESAILRRTEGILAVRELLTVDWFDLASGPRSVSVSMAHTPEEGLLVLYDPDGLPSLMAVAMGPERDLQQVAADEPHLVLPRLGSAGATLREVALRVPVCWTREDLVGIATALVGVTRLEGRLLRAEYLTFVDEGHEEAG